MKYILVLILTFTDGSEQMKLTKVWFKTEPECKAYAESRETKYHLYKYAKSEPTIKMITPGCYKLEYSKA